MIRGFLYLIAALALSAAPARAARVAFDYALVENIGNAPDPQTGLGAVAYSYAISKTEVTNAQYAAFLNAVDPTGADPHQLYNPRMASYYSGIYKTGVTDGSRYLAQAGREQKPVTFVSFLDTMRFANWLHNGQGSGDTETGAYTIADGTSEIRSPNAKFWIPSADEWYKAAYHDATADTSGVYFDYATGSNEEPISDSPEDNPAAVNYFNDDGIDNGFNDGYAVLDLDGIRFPTTDVGAYTAAPSPYGTFDQNGNVLEWNESLTAGLYRGLNGGGWSTHLEFLRIVNGNRYDEPSREGVLRGFRIATIPEPSAVGILSTLFFGLCLVGKQRQTSLVSWVTIHRIERAGCGAGGA